MFSRIHAPVRGSMASKKRKRSCISLETKLKVIDEISKGQSQRHASETSEQDNVTLEHLLLVKKWRDLAANRRRQSQIQTRIGSFFPRTEP